MRCAVYIVMGKSDPNNPDPYKQQSVMCIPAATPGITIKRMLSVFGFDDAPHGHGHLVFDNVRVPDSCMVLGPGRGFEIIQGRLGPGRIHHAMRSIGAVRCIRLVSSYSSTNATNLQAEKALDFWLARANDPRKKPFGKYLHEHGVQIDRIARARIDIDAARLTVCNAAIKIDEHDAKHALKEIAEAKVLVPAVLMEVLDKAIQAYGGAGVCQDTPLARLWANSRTMRIVDGPDEVHLQQLGKNENKRGKMALEQIERQKEQTAALFRHYGIEQKDELELNRVHAPRSKL